MSPNSSVQSIDSRSIQSGFSPLPRFGNVLSSDRITRLFPNIMSGVYFVKPPSSWTNASRLIQLYAEEHDGKQLRHPFIGRCDRRKRDASIGSFSGNWSRLFHANSSRGLMHLLDFKPSPAPIERNAGTSVSATKHQAIVRHRDIFH